MDAGLLEHVRQSKPIVEDFEREMRFFRKDEAPVFSGVVDSVHSIEDPNLEFLGYTVTKSLTSDAVDYTSYVFEEIFRWDILTRDDRPDKYVAVQYEACGESRWRAHIQTNDRELHESWRRI
tara:strand:+ start:637 stop:1002 length:366 start_codon:yes stop_codon:yes gene_type:complete